MFSYWRNTLGASHLHVSLVHIKFAPLQSPLGVCTPVGMCLSSRRLHKYFHFPDMRTLAVLLERVKRWRSICKVSGHCNHRLLGCEMMTNNDKEAGTPRDCETVKMCTPELLLLLLLLQSECIKWLPYVKNWSAVGASLCELQLVLKQNEKCKPSH